MLRVSKSQRKRLTFPYAIRSFLGHLEGTQKSFHTIKNYRLDLLSFQNFLEKASGGKPIPLEAVNAEVLESFHQQLKSEGLKTNTRRRKLLTVRKFLVYFSRRNKLTPEVAKKLPTPHKIERIPYIVPLSELVESIQRLPVTTILEMRNRLLLWTLAETGCLVSEVTQLRFEDWTQRERMSWVRFHGKSLRSLPVSTLLFEGIQDLMAAQAGVEIKDWIFLGFNKFGSLGAAISPRGVELLVKAYGPRLKYPRLTPRTFRHSAVIHWFRVGMTRDEIQKRLGLKTAYAFRSYEPLLREVQGSV